MPAPLLLDLTHTSHSRARTGIQRVTRSLHTALGPDALPITHDPHARTWRPLESWEIANLTADGTSEKRGAIWPLSAKLRGLLRRLQRSAFSVKRSALNIPPSALNVPRSAPTLPPSAPTLPPSSALLVPEVFSPPPPPRSSLFAATTGPRVALFHDAIALKFPELTPTKTVARFPAYLRELLAFDGIAAVSEDSRDSLRDYWRWLGIANPPPIQTIPLGVDLPPDSHSADSASVSQLSTLNPQLPTLLSVGSLEGRKNHLVLLEACEQLWASGSRFELRLIGLAHAQTGRAAPSRACAPLQAAGRPLHYDGPATDTALTAAYAACTFTVYPSLMEGFGLPVIESLAHGKPCVCSGRGALGESARGGGCLTLDRVDAPALAAALGRLLSTPAELAALATAARTRKFRTWSDYAASLTAWMHTLPRRS